MLNMEKVTQQTPRKVVDRAVSFFGPGGWDLEVVESDACCARFRGSGGFVIVQTEELPTGGKTKVVVQGREVDPTIREFLRGLPD